MNAVMLLHTLHLWVSFSFLIMWESLPLMNSSRSASTTKNTGRDPGEKWVGAVTRWKSMCLTHTRSWVQSPVPNERRICTNYADYKQIAQVLVLSLLICTELQRYVPQKCEDTKSCVNYDAIFLSHSILDLTAWQSIFITSHLIIFSILTF